MKKDILICFIVCFIIITITGCTITKYIPVETVKTEYKTNIQKDTLIQKDSILYKDKGDTIYLEKYSIIYKTKYKNDTIIITDTIPIIQEVEVIKEVNRLKDWQVILMLLGGGLIAVVGYKILKKILI